MPCLGCGVPALATTRTSQTLMTRHDDVTFTRSFTAHGSMVEPLVLDNQTYAPAARPGELKIVLLRAHDLLAADKGGKSDPYAKLTVRWGARFITSKSSVVKKTLHPEWRELFAFDNVDASARLSIVLMDEDKGLLDKDDPLGQADISIAERLATNDGAPMRT